MSELRSPVSFYTQGVACIKDARFLFENKGPATNFGILLIHGIELLLSSFLLVRDPTLTSRKIYNKYHHNYRDMLDTCKKLDREELITSDEVCSHISYLSERFSSSIVDLRYPKRSVLRQFPPDIFDVLETDVVAPMYLITKEWLNKDDQASMEVKGEEP